MPVLPADNSKANQRSRKGRSLLTMLVTICFISPIAAQDAPRESSGKDRNCSGLHAGIRAELVRRDPAYAQPAFVMLSFVLLNDGVSPTNSVEGGWMIVIDGKELSDSGWIFGNGPGPVGGWGTLSPGESYEFGKALPISKYFPEEREYKVYWKGKMFQSSTITVAITPPR